MACRVLTCQSSQLDRDSVCPSTPSACPEIIAPWSDARKNAAFAMSAASMKDRSDVWRS
jgi:hypothetical protein